MAMCLMRLNSLLQLQLYRPLVELVVLGALVVGQGGIENLRDRWQVRWCDSLGQS